MELSSCVLDIPNGAYITVSQNVIGCSTLSQVLLPDWLILESNEKATLNINMYTFWNTCTYGIETYRNLCYALGVVIPYHVRGLPVPLQLKYAMHLLWLSIAIIYSMLPLLHSLNF